MRIALISGGGDGFWLGHKLQLEGNTVSFAVNEERFANTLQGLIPTPEVIGATDGLDNPEAYDLVVFDFTGFGAMADYSRSLTPTIGDSSLADKLENDRIFGLEFMESCGIKVPKWEAFDNPADGLSFIRKNPKRYVFKPCGYNERSCTYVASSAEDMARYFDVLFRKVRVKQFVLQEFVKGTEISTETWINGAGNYFTDHTLECKKLMNGDLGPNTSCSGNVVWAPLTETKVFKQGLKKAVPKLQQEGYVGIIDLNAIVTDGELYGLEWTPRMGYEGTCNLTRLLPIPFGEFLMRVAIGDNLDNLIPAHAFAATVRLSIPPYPMEKAPAKMYQDGVPIDGITAKDLDTFYAQDVRVIPDTEFLETAGVSGYVGCPIGVGHSMFQAFEEVKAFISRVKIPDLQYRTDVFDVCAKRYATLEKQGWLRQ